MKGLEERLRLALEGTETGFWEWHVATDTIEWSDNMGPLYGLPRGTQPAGVNDFLERIVHPRGPRRARRADRGRGPRRHLPTSSTCASRCPTAASAGCTPAPAPSPARTAAPSGSPACSATSPSAAIARRRMRSSTPRARSSPRSMDPVHTLQEVAQLAVPRLADWCAVQLVDRRAARFEQLAVAHVDPDKVRWARELQDRYPPDPDAPTGAPAVIRTGRSELYPVIDQALLEAAALDEEQIRLVRDLQMHSVMVVPLTARDRTLGAMTFVWAESGASTRRASSSWPRSSAAAPAWRSTTRGCSRASTPRPRRSSARCCRPTLPDLPGLRARRALRGERRARPRGRRLVRRVPAARTGASGS